MTSEAFGISKSCVCVDCSLCLFTLAYKQSERWQMTPSDEEVDNSETQAASAMGPIPSVMCLLSNILYILCYLYFYYVTHISARYIQHYISVFLYTRYIYIHHVNFTWVLSESVNQNIQFKCMLANSKIVHVSHLSIVSHSHEHWVEVEWFQVFDWAKTQPFIGIFLSLFLHCVDILLLYWSSSYYL